MNKCLLIYNARLLDEAMDTPGALLVVDSKIRSVFQGYFTSADTVEQMARAVMKEDGIDENFPLELFNARNLTLTPAFIDMHVHMRYPGQTAKEDLNTGLHAAASGGYGTVVAMPNTNPVVSSFDTAMKIEREAAALGLTHLFQTVSITKNFDGKDTSHLDYIDKKFIPVITEDGRDVPESSVMLEGMTKASEKGIVVSCHCEDVSLAKMAKPFRQRALELMEETGLSAWGYDEIDFDDEEISDKVNQIDLELTKANEILALAEDLATTRNIMIAKQAECHVHLAHVSTANAIMAIREVKNTVLDEDLCFFADEAVASYQAFEEEIPFYEGKTQSLLEICDLIKNLKDKNIVITCHINPDCDAYGSSIALGIMLKAFGANVVYVNQSTHDASSFDSLSQLGYYETSKKLRNHQISKVEILSTIPDDRQFDMAFMLDGKLDRAGSVANVLKERSIPIVKIDHHVDEGGAFRDVDSTCEIVSGIYKILSQEHKFTFTQNDAISRCLYTGWASDTNGFSFSSENKRAHILRGFISDNTKIQTNVSDEKGKNDTYYRNLKDKVTDNFESRLFRHKILSLYDELYNEIQIRYVPYKIRKLYPKIPIRITSDFYRASGCVSFFEQEDGSLTFNLCLKKDRYGGDRFNFKAIDLIKAIDQNGGGHVNAGGGILSEQIFEQERLNKIIQLIPEQARDIKTNAYIYKTLYNINKIKQENISNDEKLKNISEIVFFLPDEILDQVLELNSSLGEFDFINDNSELLVRFLRDCILNRFNSIAW